MKYFSTFAMLIAAAVTATETPAIYVLNGTVKVEFNKLADESANAGLQTENWNALSPLAAIAKIQEDCNCKMSDADKVAIFGLYGTYHNYSR